VAGAGSSGGGQTPAIARNGGKGGGKEGRELLDSSRLPVTRLVSLNSARLLESRQQYEALVAAHDSLLAPKTRSHGAVSARTARCTCCQDFELPAECGEYVWLLWGQLEANLRVRQQSFRDLSLGFVFAINNLYLLASLLDQLPDLRQTMRQAGQEVQDAIDDNCDKLIQRCWLAPLQVPFASCLSAGPPSGLFLLSSAWPCAWHWSAAFVHGTGVQLWCIALCLCASHSTALHSAMRSRCALPGIKTSWRALLVRGSEQGLLAESEQALLAESVVSAPAE